MQSSTIWKGSTCSSADVCAGLLLVSLGVSAEKNEPHEKSLTVSLISRSSLSENHTHCSHGVMRLRLLALE